LCGGGILKAVLATGHGIPFGFASESARQFPVAYAGSLFAQQEGTIELSGTVECDEVYVIAGHKGHPDSVKKGRKPRKRRLVAASMRGTRMEMPL